MDDLCQLCIAPKEKDGPSFMRGVELKKGLAIDIIERWRMVAKLAYFEASPTGLFNTSQYR
ncbi:MAG: hypothetical protein ACUVUS_02750 [Thermoproteota archaeon]